MADLPDDVREIAQDYVDDRLQMKAEQAVGTLAKIGNAMKSTGQAVLVGAAHLLDPIPGAPIGRGVEVLTGTPAHEAYEGMSADAQEDYAVSHAMAASFAGFPALQALGGIVGKVFRNVSRAGRGVQRVFLKNSALLRKVQIRNYERKIGKINESLAKKSQRHHIFPQGEKEVKTLFDQIGLSVHDSNNIVRLPNKTGAKNKAFGKDSIHVGKHNEAYTDRIQKEIDLIVQRGKDFHFSQDQYKAEVYKAMERTACVLRLCLGKY
jgi:hypothetical protein